MSKKLTGCIDSELIVVGHVDATRKRVVVRCLACLRTFVIGVSAVGGARCVCAPLTAERRDALRAEARGLDMQRTQRNWRPQR
jgi:hypothetical protein